MQEKQVGKNSSEDDSKKMGITALLDMCGESGGGGEVLELMFKCLYFLSLQGASTHALHVQL